MLKKNYFFTLLVVFIIAMNFVQAIPRIEPYVNDFAGLMTKEEANKLNMLADQIEVNSSWEVAIVTVKGTEGLDRIEYANKIGDENGVGKKDKDNGLVVLWSTGEDRGGAIATGRYSESIFNDAKVGRIGRDSRHFFDEGNYYEGFNFILLEIKEEIEFKEINNNQTNNNSEEVSSEEKGGALLAILFVALIGGLIIIFIIVPLISESTGDSFSSVSSRSSSSSGGFSRGGFSGGSFGGGSFGGGGARF